MNDTREFNVDVALRRLEEINARLSNSNIELAESLELYKEGVLLANQCQEHLVGVEQFIQTINGPSDDDVE